MIYPVVTDALVARQWNCDERLRQRQRHKVTRLKEQQRIAGMTKWAGRNSNSANTQVAVKRAIRDWFNAARGEEEGVAIPVLVDAVIMLGLNHDFKQVQRTASSDAHDNVGGQLTLKGFTAALLECCSSPNRRDRLFRSLRGEGEDWRRYGGAGEQEDGGNKLSPPDTAAMPTGAPTFVTQLAAYRRKVLMATVADKFPTPCTSTFWTPDCERHTDMRNKRAKRRGANVPRLNETSSEQTPPSIPGGESLAAHSGKPYTPEGVVVHPCVGSNVHEEKLPMPSSLPEPGIGVSVETRRRYNAVSEGIFLSSVSTPTSDSPSRGTRKTSAASAASTPQQARLKHKAQSRTTPVAPGGTDRGGNSIPKRSAKEISRKQAGPGQERGTQRFGSSRSSFTNGSVQGACATNVSSRERSTGLTSPEKQRDSGRWMGRVLESGLLTGDGGFDEEDIKETARRLRDSMLQTELTLAKSEARWGDYQVMKRRWRRRTPLGILTDDELDEDNRSYSRLSRPNTNEGTGGGSRGRTTSTADAGSTSKQSSRLCSGPSICRPSTAPACCSAGLRAGSSVTGFMTVTSNNSSRFPMRKSSNREGGEGGRIMSKPLPLGPITLYDGDRKLRYPLLELKEKERAESARRGNLEVGRDSALSSPGVSSTGRHAGGARGFVEIPVTREWKGEKSPCLVRVPWTR